jgi:transposase
VSTTFPFTYPRRWALSTGVKLIRWARRPATTADDRRRKSERRREAQLRAYQRDQRLRELRERDIVRYLSQVRPYV